jgi:hypothetical protein
LFPSSLFLFFFLPPFLTFTILNFRWDKYYLHILWNYNKSEL